MMPLIVTMACDGDKSDNVSATENPTSDDVVPVSSASRADSAYSAPSSSPKVKVLFFGTSLTAGYGLDPAVAFPRLVAQQAAAEGVPIAAINAGLSGETSAGAVRRIDWTLKVPVDVVVLETGGNDALRALNADSLQKNLRALVDRVQRAQPDAKILLAVMEAPPNLGASYTKQFREAYVSVARETGVSLMPFLLEGVAGHAELNQADGVHPNEKGERVVAANVWKGLKPVVQQVARTKDYILPRTPN
jgi:acyl-CoA thioesterase-1